MVARKRLALALVVALAMFVVACGSSDSGSSSSGGGGGGSASTTATGVTKGVAKAPTLAAAKGAKGTVVYCTGKDTSGGQKASVKAFNAKYSPGPEREAPRVPESADLQHDQFAQRQQAKSSDCDIFYSDVVWTAEFASQKWLLDMSDYVNSRKSEFVPSTLSTIQFDGKYFGTPKQTDAGFIYNRNDKVQRSRPRGRRSTPTRRPRAASSTRARPTRA